MTLRIHTNIENLHHSSWDSSEKRREEEEGRCSADRRVRPNEKNRQMAKKSENKKNAKSETEICGRNHFF